MAESPTDRCCIDAPHCTCAYEAAVDALNTYLRGLSFADLANLLRDAGYATTLARWGRSVTTASNGADAMLLLLRDPSYRSAFLDAMGMDVIEVATGHVYISERSGANAIIDAPVTLVRTDLGSV